MTCDDITCQSRNVCTSERKQAENERGGTCYDYLLDPDKDRSVLGPRNWT